MKCLALAAGVAALVMSACAGTPPTRTEIQTADFGAMPTNPEPAIRAYFDKALKDPESARYEFGKPVKGYYGKTLSNLAGPRDLKYGWLVPTGVNAKNGYGGYTGTQLYHCWFRDDTLVQVIDPSKLIRQVEDSAPITDDSQ